MTEESDKQPAATSSKANDESAVDPKEYLDRKITIDPPSGPQCYCMNPRNYSVADFQCSVCYRWFHLDCIAFNIGKSLPFLTAYHFMCKKCNPNEEEVFSRKQANFAVMCQTALANLMWRHNGRLYFSKEKELIPFLEEFWEELTTQPRKGHNAWYPNIHKSLTSSDAFKVVENDGDLLVCLSNTDIGKMGPSYDRFRALTSQLRTNITKLVAPATGACAQNAGSVSDGGGCADPLSAVGSKPGLDSDSSDSQVGWRKRKSPGSSTIGQIAAGGSGTTPVPTGGFGHYSGAAIAGGGFHGSNNGDFNGIASGGVEFGSNGFGARGPRTNGSAVATANGGAATGGLVRPTRRTAGATGICSATALGNVPSGFPAPDEGRAKLNAFGFPVDHPLNKEGYRYILVEVDKHAAGRDVWDECEHTAGKPIPGMFYRVYLSPQVVLSLNDRANHLKLHESQLIITGEKGYCMARATHGVHTGTWYYEATITDQPEGSATRIGWSQMLGNLQAPCGYDKFSYSWRSRFGTVFHESRGKHYAETGYKKDDVIGLLIQLPSASAPLKSRDNVKVVGNSLDSVPTTESTTGDAAARGKSTDQSMKSEAPNSPRETVTGSETSKLQFPSYTLPDSYKDRPLIKFRNSYYFEEKDEPGKAEKLLRPLPGSKITFYRNGENLGTAFTDIYAGLYYPSVSIYRSATVSVNFGPTFQYPPTDVDGWQPMSERLVTAAVEQTVADMLYLVENEGLVDRMIKSYAGGS